MPAATMGVVASTVPDPSSSEEAFRGRIAKVLDGTFVAASLGMPTEDARTAMDVLWASFEALMVQHFPAQHETAPPVGAVPDATHWSRILVTAVTNSIVLGGGFVRPARVGASVLDLVAELRAGGIWHTRRPPGPGAVVLACHARLLLLDHTAGTGRQPGPADQDAVDGLVALAALGSVLTGEGSVPAGRAPAPTAPDGAEVARRAEAAARSFGVPEVGLVPVERTGWACDACGCVFAGRVEAGIAYPDRMAPVGRGGPCDAVTDCACHAAPLQRRVR